MLCDRFHVTPDEARAMDADVFRLLRIAGLAASGDGGGPC